MPMSSGAAVAGLAHHGDLALYAALAHESLEPGLDARGYGAAFSKATWIQGTPQAVWG